MPDDLKTAALDRTRQLAMQHHNHPDSSPFSAEDLRSLSSCPGISIVKGDQIEESYDSGIDTEIRGDGDDTDFARNSALAGRRPPLSAAVYLSPY